MELNLTKKDKLEIVENSLSWIVVMGMLIYGVMKPWQFGAMPESVLKTPIGELEGMGLMWVFYGYSKTFVILLGVLEVSGGLLILVRKTRIFGCLLCSTVLVNIILQDIFYDVNAGALRAAIIYQSMILAIMWLNRESILQAAKNLLIRRHTPRPPMKIIITKLALALVLFIILRLAEFYLTH